MKFKMASVSALCFSTALVASAGAAANAPASLQFDEIVRVTVGEDAPPSPGSFQTHLAAINNPPSAEAVQAPAKRHGFGNLIGAVLQGNNPVGAAADDVAGNAASNAASNAMGGLFGSLNAFGAFMHQGKLARYTFYNGWERVDDVAAHTATITKGDRHQSIALNLEKKTYSVNDLSAEVPHTPTAATSRAKAPAQQPGTAIVELSLKGTALGPVVLDGVPTTGYGNTITMAMTQATGSCRNGSFSVVSSQYVSVMKDPQLILAVPSAARVPTDPRAMLNRGGCAPTFTARSSGATPPGGRLSMYSRIAMQPQNASPANTSSFAFITERGNVKALSALAAAPLFEIPAGFVRE